MPATGGHGVDALTGLASRPDLTQALDAASRRPDARPLALLVVDVVGFRRLNDSYGHAAGDDVLRAVAHRLRAVAHHHLSVTTAPEAPRSDEAGLQPVLARLGGDEFGVLVTLEAAHVERLAAAVVAALAHPVAVPGTGDVPVRVVVGVAVGTTGEGAAGESLLVHAGLALSEARHGSTGWALMSGDDRDHAAQSVVLRRDMEQTCVEQFRVVYQPQVDLASGQLRGFEALMRWRHPLVGEVSPARFIPMAEECGAIGVLGLHVLRSAVAQVARWRSLAPGDLTVSVNVSPVQLTQPGFADQALQVLAEAGLPARALALEVTEQALLRDVDTAALALRRLRSAGLRVSIDDFGTGYSSLRYLVAFEADELKVDRSFVLASASPRSAAVVRGVVALAAESGLHVVAEGVETQAQLDLVRSAGCPTGQGYLLSRPLEVADATALVVGSALPVPRSAVC